jgi:hypothetical protein
VQSYFVESLRIAGWADVKAAKLQCVHDGAAACAWILTWRPR